MRKNLIGVGLIFVVGAPCASLHGDTHSNGPFVTHPGGGFQGKDASALQTAILLNVYGFGHAATTGVRVADDLTVPTGEDWVVKGLHFFGYQTGMTTTTTTFTNVSVGLWKTKPVGTATAPDLMPYTNFPLSASNSKFTNCYRPLDTTVAVETSRPIWRNSITLATPITLEPGDYWIDWQSAGTLASGPWCPPVTIKDAIQKPGANALQFNGSAQNAWANLIDTGETGSAQDLLFEVEYDVVIKDCYANCDGNGALEIDDFICFQTQFAIGDPYADCDGSGGLDIDDFVCFQALFATGC